MIRADPLDPSPPANPAGHGRPRRRWKLWRSPTGQPVWARPALLAVAAAATALYAWNITQAGLAPFYSVAVKSMSESWKAFFYGALDPNATVTIDMFWRAYRADGWRGLAAARGGRGRGRLGGVPVA
jgi:hypothetical protein